LLKDDDTTKKGLFLKAHLPSVRNEQFWGVFFSCFFCIF